MYTMWLEPDYNARLDLETDEEILLTKIKSCHFKDGLWSDSDEFFEQLRINYSGMDIPLKILSDIVNKHIDDSHVLEGVLHILSFFGYSELVPIGISIVLACTNNHSLMIQNLIISLIRKWQRPQFIAVLENLVLDGEDYLMEYRDEVINELNTL